ncbi:MAG: SCO family protein [Pseudomonadales bacterium]|nr:SCO family protein [Pseudomonadales bacterium]
MTEGVRNTLVGIAAFISLVLGLFFYNFLTPRELSDEQYQQLGYYKYPQARDIKPFRLLDQDGNTASLNDLKGKTSLLFFGFTYCPDICPTTLGVINRAVQKLQNPPQVVLVSVDPERDTPAQLKQYLSGFNDDFIGFTGTFDDIVGLATNVNIAFGKVPGTEPGTYTVDHSASIVVVDTAGKYAGFIKAPHDEQNIIRIVEAISQASR